MGAERLRWVVRFMFGPSTVLAHRDITYIDEQLLDQSAPREEYRLRVVPSRIYEGIPHGDLQYWCAVRAFYGLPTTELVAWLSDQIGGRCTIEVGSGTGALGRALGIPRTDSFNQQQPDVALLYALSGQQVIAYGSDVERLEALDAVKKYRPKVVVGQWVTEYVAPGETPGPGGGSVYGLKERDILAQPCVDAYVVVGNSSIHGLKSIAREVPQGWALKTYRFPWVWSRATKPEMNCIMVWSRCH